MRNVCEESFLSAVVVLCTYFRCTNFPDAQIQSCCMLMTELLPHDFFTHSQVKFSSKLVVLFGVELLRSQSFHVWGNKSCEVTYAVCFYFFNYAIRAWCKYCSQGWPKVRSQRKTHVVCRGWGQHGHWVLPWDLHCGESLGIVPKHDPPTLWIV